MAHRTTTAKQGTWDIDVVVRQLPHFAKRAGAILREWRMRHDLQQAQLACLVNRSVDTIRRWERGGTELPSYAIVVFDLYRPGLWREIRETSITFDAQQPKA